MKRHKRGWLHLIDWSQPIYNDADLDNALADARRFRCNAYSGDTWRKVRFHRIINNRMMVWRGDAFIVNQLTGSFPQCPLP